MHKLTSKYKVGDGVWGIYQSRKVFNEACPQCGGEGVAKFDNGSTVSCHRCYGKGTIPKESYQEWCIDACLTVGMVRVEEFFAEKKVSYMCQETGIGSGRVWYEELLWLSRDEAQAECDRLNKEMEK